MALKILNDEELELLSNEQIVEYKEALELYRQRVEFVEQLEKIENSRIEPYEPKLKRIASIKNINTKSFKKKKFVIHMDESLIKSSLRIKTFEKVNRKSPDIPTIESPKVRNLSVKKVEVNKPTLLTESSINIKSVIVPKKMKNNLKHSPIKFPEVVVPDINIDFAISSVKKHTLLPEVIVNTARDITFVKRDREKIELPTIAKLNFDVNFCKEQELPITSLPEMQLYLDVKQTKFSIPEYKSKEMPKIKEPRKININFIKPKYSIKNLPKAFKINFVTKEFTKIQNNAKELPAFLGIKNVVTPFEKKRYKRSDLPDISKVDVKIRDFNCVEKCFSNIIAPSVPSVESRTFTFMKKTVPDMPKISINDGLDVYLKLKTLLLATNEK